MATAMRGNVRSGNLYDPVCGAEGDSTRGVRPMIDGSRTATTQFDQTGGPAPQRAGLSCQFRRRSKRDERTSLHTDLGVLEHRVHAAAVEERQAPEEPLL